jgi:hypothetical protein
MDKELLLRADVQEFIREHEADDLHTLSLQRQKYPNFPLVEIIEQIKARKKAKLKLTQWYNTVGILFPKPVSIEQASSEMTATWKAQYIGRGKTGVDLTGGFGVDSHFFAKNFLQWTHVEPNTDLQEAVKHNNALLGNDNIDYSNLKSEEYLEQIEKPVDFIYLDPDRRPSTQRVIGFKDSQPSVSQLLPKLKELGSRVLIKASPMIDISAGLKELEAVTRVIIISLKNEVKEVLFDLDFNSQNEQSFRCVDLDTINGYEFNYEINNDFQEVIEISSQSNYLYEPGAAILKAGGQDILASRYGLNKLNRNTNLYTTEQGIANYPGRIFKVLANLPYKKKAIAEFLKDNRANLSTRNFIDSPEKMKKKLGLRDGGDIYLFGYRDLENKNKVAVCKKIESNDLHNQILTSHRE